MLLGALLVYGLYAYHCHARHELCGDVRQELFRIISVGSWSGRVGRVGRHYMNNMYNRSHK